MNTFHYTNKTGYDAIRSQPDWTFKASQPMARHRPSGAYFTDMAPTPENLRSLCARIRLPRSKREYVFWFVGREGLTRLNGGRGRDQFIWYSKGDYVVSRESGRQRMAEAVETVGEALR